MAGVKALKPTEAIHDTLAPIYETVRILARELPTETTLIGFAGAPWTVATYMIAGRGTPDQAAAHALKAADRATFQALIDRITEATIEYLSTQVEAGAEVVKLFDSWAGSLKGQDFQDFAVEPAARIIAGAEGPPPRPADHRLPARGGRGLHRLRQGAPAPIAWRSTIRSRPEWARRERPEGRLRAGQPRARTHGHRRRRRWTRPPAAWSTPSRKGPHIFNLGHGITPDADPENVTRMIEVVRGG